MIDMVPHSIPSYLYLPKLLRWGPYCPGYLNSLAWGWSVVAHKVHFWLQKEYSEQWALACGEILRVLTHYNRPIFKVAECNNTSDQATASSSSQEKANCSTGNESERKPLRPLSPWITDILLTAPLGIRSDYFRWWVIIFVLFPRWLEFRFTFFLWNET